MSTRQETRPGARQRLAGITVVGSIGCHFCADADSALAELASQYAIEVTHIPMTSPQGMGLMQRHGAGMSPLVLLDGVFVGSGRLPRGRIRRMLDSGGFERRVSAP